MTEQQKIEHLLRKRVKMIASYPGAKTEVFDILYWHRPEGWKSPIYTTNPDNLLHAISLKHSEVEPYDHLFKRLEWWEERTESEMTGYIKRGGAVFEMNILDKDLMQWKFGGIKRSQFLPATKAEYESFMAKAGKIK